MKALLHYRASARFQAVLKAAAPPWLELEVVDETNSALLARHLPDAEVLLHVLEPVTPAMIASAPKLRLIQKIGVGLNTIDLDAARQAGIAVANMPGTNTQAVAEMTLVLMFACLRRVVLLDSAVRRGAGWRMDREEFDRVGEIAGKTFGLLGFGAVPNRLAPILTALGAQVVAWSRTPKQHPDVEFLAFDDVIRAAHVLSLHLPAAHDTHHLLNASCFARMRPQSIVINTARGSLIDESALRGALASGQLAAAGLDVFEREPLGGDDPLLAFPQVVTSPHCAWLTPETLARSTGVIMENCRRLGARETLLHEVLPARRLE